MRGESSGGGGLLDRGASAGGGDPLAKRAGGLADRRGERGRCDPPVGAGAATRLILAAAAIGCAAAAAGAEPRHILLFIGDGMGSGHVATARAFLGRPLVFERFPFRAVAVTTPAAGGITDSRAASTAMSTGQRVGNGVISREFPGSGSNLVTLAEHGRARGYRVGLVTTSSLVDATPAAFCAHSASRWNYAEIVADYLRPDGPDLLLGGGGAGLTAAAMIEAGYVVVRNRAEMLAACASASPRVGGLFGPTALPYEYDGLGELPALDEMTAAALQFLESKGAPFFLMVEGGRIDHAAHGNDLGRCLHEMAAFDRAVAVAAEWAAGRSDALLVVTADHETGGLDLIEDRGAGQFPAVQWSTTGHTAGPVPVYAWGCGANRVIGVEHLVDIHGLLTDATFPPPVVRGLSRGSAGAFELSWRAISGRTYRVETRPAASGTAWLLCTALTAEANGTITASVGPMASPPAAQLYRVAEVP